MSTGSQPLVWKGCPSKPKPMEEKNLSNILIIKKPTTDLIDPFQQLICYLISSNNFETLVIEGRDWQKTALAQDPSSLTCGSTRIKFLHVEQAMDNERTFDEYNQLSEEAKEILNSIDIVICLGGDGTFLYASSLFQGKCPPILPFKLGSLGFLTSFNFLQYQSVLKQCFSGELSTMNRTRLNCRIKSENRNGNFLILNDITFDRGISPNFSFLRIYINDKFVTTVQGDGLIIATPTGSTSYAMSAGSSLVHPLVSAMLIVPICPHTLSFRPVVIPAENVRLRITMDDSSRSNCNVLFDGRHRMALQPNESIEITLSDHPIPTVCLRDSMHDWFSSLAECLHWNHRVQQKAMD
ncbi:hypothetical protein SNEBB_001588 [Seison nebaliae]|nr:hypothetical protein SNEBB_001588 [Seison nebaliae]